MSGSSAPAGRTPRELRWPLKRSFVEYAASVPDFRIYTDAGAEVRVRSHEVFVWPAPELGLVTREQAWRFTGGVDLVGYGGMMNVSLHLPEIREAGGSAQLSFVPRSDGAQASSQVGSQARARAVFAELTDPVWSDADATVTWQARATEFAAEALGGVYSVGTVLDPVVTQWSAVMEASGGE